jgi:hypothetical protein
MCALPGFDSAVLRTLIDATHSADTVAFLRAVTLDLLGHDPLAAALGPFRRPAALPVDLWWDGVDGFLTDLGWRPGQLVVRDESPLSVLRRLGATTLAVPLTGTPVPVAALGGEGPAAPRFVHRVVAGERFDTRVAVSAGEHGLTVDLSVPAAGPQWMTAVSYNFGDHRWEAFFADPAQPVQFDDYSITEHTGRAAAVAAHRADGRDVIRVDLPWARLGNPQRRAEPLALLLGLRRQRLPWGETAAGVLLPLELHLTGAVR